MAVVVTDSRALMNMGEVSKKEYVQAVNTLRRFFTVVGREVNAHMFVASNDMYESSVPHWMRDGVHTFALIGSISAMTLKKLPYTVSVAIADEQRIGRGGGMLLRGYEYGSEVCEKFQAWCLPYDHPKEESAEFNQHREEYRKFLASIPSLYPKVQDGS